STTGSRRRGITGARKSSRPPGRTFRPAPVGRTRLRSGTFRYTGGPMKRSEQRILTTHVGSLPRTTALRDLLVRQDRGEKVDAATLARESETAVRHVVAKQLETGIDIGNDGEQPRVGFSTYPAKRMRGFGGASKRRMSRDIAEHPDYMARLARMRTGAARINDAPQAIAEVAYTDLSEATAECDLFQRGVA